jgi:hypothetical protein
MRVLVSGSRDWDRPDVIYDVLRRLKAIDPDLVIIHGDCRGADKMAGDAARRLHCPLDIYPADWDRYGARAGPIRNQEMIDKGRPDFALIFHPDLSKSKGTAGMVKLLKLHKVTVEYYRG